MNNDRKLVLAELQLFEKEHPEIVDVLAEIGAIHGSDSKDGRRLSVAQHFVKDAVRRIFDNLGDPYLPKQLRKDIEKIENRGLDGIDKKGWAMLDDLKESLLLIAQKLHITLPKSKGSEIDINI